MKFPADPNNFDPFHRYTDALDKYYHQRKKKQFITSEKSDFQKVLSKEVSDLEQVSQVKVMNQAGDHYN